MLKINRLLITIVLIFIGLPLAAQNNTNSPYTRFGYGDLGDRSFGAGRAMGGVGYGLRSPKQINPMNPASYSCMDSLTFLFDFGVAGQLSWFDDGNSRQHDINGNLEYIALQFPVHRRIAFLSDLYGGISIDLWKKRLAVGANFGFLFGNITHEQVVLMSSEGTGAYNTSRSQELRIRDIKMDFGIQYTHPFSRTESVTLGFVFSPKNSLNADSYQLTQSYTSSGSDSEIIQSDTIRNRAFGLPNSYGVGLSYVKQNKLTLAVDFSYEDWGKMLYFGERDNFKNRYRVAAGVEYIPDYMRNSYFGRIRYRAGVHYGNSYLRMNRTDANPSGDSYNEIGASIGFGFPLIDLNMLKSNRSMYL